MKTPEEILDLIDAVIYRGKPGREEKLFILGAWEKSLRHSEAIKKGKKHG